MGGLDKYVDASFKKRDDGKLVYYPYANFGPKYILSTESEARIRTFLKIYYIFGIGTPILVSLRSILLGFLSLILVISFYLVGITIILSSSEKTEVNV
ncbi:MAG: hypothetical protein QMD94_05275 [Candidatus Omnitrophota bacterium]|nr:hypothetical protein [Candidatus Omnitrophota bacterium]